MQTKDTIPSLTQRALKKGFDKTPNLINNTDIIEDTIYNNPANMDRIIEDYSLKINHRLQFNQECLKHFNEVKCNTLYNIRMEKCGDIVAEIISDPTGFKLLESFLKQF